MESWSLLEQTSERVEAAAKLPPGLFSAIASRLEEALAEGSRDALMSMDRHLSAFLKTYVKRSGKTVADALRHVEHADEDIAAAFALGQISFAQLLAAQAANRRADDAFEALVQENSVIVLALLEKDLAGLDLAEATGLRPETISRKIKILRDHGITDFYREGTSVLNFLTPAAKSIATTLSDDVTATHGGSAVRKSVNAHRRRLPDHMRGPLTFALPVILEPTRVRGARR